MVEWTSDPFGQTLQERFEATVSVGHDAYGPPTYKAPGKLKWPGPQNLAEGFERIKHLIPKDRLSAVREGSVNSYGAWNPVAMFIGLSGGGQGSGLLREHEHVIGCPGLFARRPGVKGNPYFPEAIRDITIAAFRHITNRGGAPWAQAWLEERPYDFDAGAGSLLLMLNLSAEELRMGTNPTIEEDTAAGKLRRHVRTFKPRVLIAVKPQVSELLDGALPEAGIGKSLGQGEERVEPISVNLDGTRLPFITMPVHPNATGTGFARFRDSKPRVAAAIAQALGGG